MTEAKRRYRTSPKGRLENRLRMRRRRALLRGGAAKKLRMSLNDANAGYCAVCITIGNHYWFLAKDLEVDHIAPLADGGLDTDDNVQVLCNTCHDEKTAQEARDRCHQTKVADDARK